MPLPEGKHILHTTGELSQRLFKICASMEAENAVRRQGRYFMLKSYLVQLLLLVIREQCEPMERPKGYAFESAGKKYVAEQVINYIEDHYSEKISLDQIAENMYLSPFYISRIFKGETGNTPIRHLINIRLEKAKRLLERWQRWSGMMMPIISASCLKRNTGFRRPRSGRIPDCLFFNLSENGFQMLYNLVQC